MKALALVALVFVGLNSLAADAGVPISKERASAILAALPEFVKLKQDYAAKPDDLIVDGLGLESADPSARAKIGSKVWRMDVYTTVHDGPEMAHGNPWAFFVVDAFSGAVFIAQPDLNSSTGHWVYLSLLEWRKQRRSDKPPVATAPSRRS